MNGAGRKFKPSQEKKSHWENSTPDPCQTLNSESRFLWITHGSACDPNPKASIYPCWLRGDCPPHTPRSARNPLHAHSNRRCTQPDIRLQHIQGKPTPLPAIPRSRPDRNSKEVAGQMTQPNAICNVHRENIFRKMIVSRRPGGIHLRLSTQQGDLRRVECVNFGHP